MSQLLSLYPTAGGFCDSQPDHGQYPAPYTDDFSTAMGSTFTEVANVREPAMARAPVCHQSQRKHPQGESMMSSNAWPFYPTIPANAQSYPLSPANSAATTGGSASSYPVDSGVSSYPVWGKASPHPSGVAPAWSSHPVSEPFIMPEQDQQISPNDDMVRYATFANRPAVMGKSGSDNVLLFPWGSSGFTGLSSQARVFGRSELDTHVSSLSPKSLPSNSDNESSFNIDGEMHHPPSNGVWPNVTTAQYSTIKESSPQHTQLPLLSESHNMASQDSASQHASLSMSVPMYGTGNGALENMTTGQNNMTIPVPYFRHLSNGRQVFWPAQGNPNASQMPSILPSSNQGHNSFSFSQNEALMPYPVSALPSRTRASGRQWAEIDNTDDQPQPSQRPSILPKDIQAQRKEEDEVLLKGKAEGLTYKEIRKRLKTPVAESTLRGRFRSLTKARKDRVRKPVWTSIDVKLLREIVLEEMDRTDDGTRALSRKQLASKLSWKKIADYIAENGGTYHFGNSTCKKKWVELESLR
ncbi:hypothetical protein BS50DRAFT_591389 [Corynespora cassiicola Philippines]|uniref:Myb-like domain-containing protein n=1 Tax=Corynespora cassiicola Philippines TaxID=1448308 RepID=A0A2T2ND98_CORCC|nr:hypothetical protein BS50DRAFT_591389 [Corynespora cassiicola Philippines]